MSEFSDRPFVAGSLTGMRAFSVDSLGRLIGPSFPQIFTPGENLAVCRRPSEGAVMFFGSTMSSFLSESLGFGGPRSEPTPDEIAERKAKAAEAAEKARLAEEERKKNHTLACLACTCGFYAYFDGGNDYKSYDKVTALIEGYGVCTVGSRGFRASKARLVAVVRPGNGFGNKIRAGLIERNYPDVPFYDRKRDALATHPLSVEALPTPEAEDFWTREAK